MSPPQPPERTRTMKTVKRIRDQKIIRDLIDTINGTISAVRSLPAVLTAYEHTGDHDHGHGSLLPGTKCSGGDCLVSAARRLIRSEDPLVEALRDISPEEARAIWHALASTVENEEADECPSKHHAVAAALCSRLDAAMVETHGAAA